MAVGRLSERGSRRVGEALPLRMRGALMALAACALATGWTAAGAEATLRWKFKPGETLRYTMVQETEQGMKAMGQEFKTVLNQTVDLHWSIKGVSNDGVADMTQTIDRVRTKIQGPGDSFEFDSTEDKAPQGQIATMLTPLLKSLIGAEFSFKMSGRGELSEIKVPQKMLESIRQLGPAAAGGMFSEEGMKNLINQSSLSLPKESLSEGQSWPQQSKVPVPMVGTMIMDKTYTFKGVDPKAANLVRIGLDTKVTLEPAANANNVDVKIKTQSGKGEFLFNAEAGRIVTSRVNDQLLMVISVQGQQLEQSTSTNTTMSLAPEGSPK